MENPDRLKIVFIEDQIPDTELVIQHLEKKGIKLLPKRVKTKDEFVDALKYFKPDLILTDYFHSALDGKTTLSLTKNYDHNIPVIIFSQIIDQKTVVECLKYGATDYVLKNNIDELPAVITEAINRKRNYHEKSTADYVLRESMETFQRLFEVSTDPILFLEDNSFIDCNPSAISILGYKTKFDIIGKKPWEISPEFQPDGRTSVSSAAENIQLALKKGHHKFEWLHFKSNGDELPVEVMLTPVMLNGKQLFYVIWRDISERKKAEKALIESEEKYREQASLLKHYYDLPFIGMAITSPESKKWLQVNDRLCEILGYTREELLEKTWLEITHPEDVEVDITEFEKILNGQSDSYAMDKRFIRKDGVIIHATIDVKCVRRPDRRIDFFVATIQDITDRKSIEEEFRTTLYSIGDAVITTDICGNVKRMNNIAESLTGWKESEAKGKNLAEIFKISNEDTHITMENPVAKVLRDGVTVGLANHTILISKDGKEIPISDSGSPIRTGSNEIIGVVLVFRDQTAEREAEKKLRNNEAMLENTQARAHLGGWELDLQTGSGLWSKEMFRLHGLEPAETPPVFDEFIKYVHPDDRDELIRRQDEAIKNSEDFNFDYKTNPELCPQRIINARFSCIKNLEGKIIKLIGSNIDITERNLAETETKLSHQRLRQVIDLVPHFVFAKDIDGKFILANKAIAEAYGTTIENLIGKSDADFDKNISELEHFRNDDLEVIKNGKQKIIPEEVITDASGNVRTLQTLKIPFTFSGTTTPAVLGVAVDITERKKAELALKNSEEKFRKVVQNAEAVLFVLDEKGTFVLSEGLALNKLGLKPGQVVGMSAFDVYKDHPTIFESINKALKGEITRIINVIGDTHFDTVYSPYVNTDGKLTGVLGLAIDVTERIKVETELIRAKEKAELSSRLKDAFIANISHEIRTPLNGILGMKSLIQEAFSKYASNDEEFYFSSIDRSSRRLMRTVDMILNFSRIQAGDFPINPKPLNLQSIITNLINEFRIIAQAKSIELTFVDELKDLRIIADEYTVTQIISNLLDNAIKYTKIGFVKVVLYQNHENHIMIDVIDSGIGIMEEYKQNLFKPYSQEEVGYSRSYEGIGLGLSIVQKFAELNKAQITVESKKGEGSTFTVHFIEGTVEKPKRLDKKEKEINSETKIVITKPKSKTKPFVLVVEDDLTSQDLIKTILKKYYQVVIVTTAQEAIDTLKINPFELILMDISIRGGVSGLELTKLLRKTDEYSEIPIIAVTAHAFPSDHQRSLEAGCNEYISKPFEAKELLEKIRELIEV